MRSTCVKPASWDWQSPSCHTLYTPDVHRTEETISFSFLALSTIRGPRPGQSRSFGHLVQPVLVSPECLLRLRRPDPRIILTPEDLPSDGNCSVSSPGAKSLRVAFHCGGATTSSGVWLEKKNRSSSTSPWKRISSAKTDGASRLCVEKFET